MTPPDRSSPPPDAFTNCDAAYLRALREAADMDVLVLARKACLSAGQVRELESGESGRYFYSDTIKRQAYKRVLMVLGVTPPTHPTPTPSAGVVSADDARLEVLDQIAAMSHRPALARPVFSAFHVVGQRLQKHKQPVGAFLLLLLALGGLAIYGTRRATAHTPTVTAHAPAPSPAAIAAIPVIAETKTPPQPVAATPAATADTACAFSTEAMPQLTPLQAHKEGRYVYLVSSTTAQVCVVDAQKRATLLQMKAGESQSVYGTAPWQISSANLSLIKIYFQGGLVALPEGASQRLSLVEASVTR